MPPKPLSFGTLLGGSIIRFLGSVYATAQESLSPYVIFFPIAGVAFLEGTSSSPTACRMLELQNCGWEGMIVSSSLCFTFYMFQKFICVVPYVAISLFHMTSHVVL